MTESTAPAEEGQAAEVAPSETGQANENVEQQTQSAWYDSADDEIKGYIQNKGWDDPIKAVKSYKELEQYRGASEDQLIKMPKEGESWDAVYDKLGRPESPDKYEIDLGENVPQIDEQRLNTFKSLAHELGLNNEQAQKIAEADSQYAQQFMQQHQEQINEQHQVELNELEKEWGSAFEERTELGRRFIRQNLPSDVEDKEGMLNSIEQAIGPRAMLKLFASAGEKGLSREDNVPDSSGDRPYGYSPEQAKADKATLMKEIQANPERLATYNKGKGPDNDKMKRLIEIASG